MSIDMISPYISNWYGMRRLQQAVSTGILRGVSGQTARAVAPVMEPLIGDKVKSKANYDHPYLGKHLDILV